MEIGKIIKKLRRERDLTQEELAELIGVTAQAVSKWESGAGLPDISQVVPLSHALGTSTDILFGTSEAEEQKRIEEVYAQTAELFADESGSYEGRHEKVVALWRDLAQALPNNSDVQIEFASYAFGAGEDSQREAIRILERVADKSAETRVRAMAVSRMSNVYSSLGEFNKARELAETLPEAYLSREEALKFAAFVRLLRRLGMNNNLNIGVQDSEPIQISREDADELLAPIKDAFKQFAQLASSALFQFADFRRRLGIADKDEYVEQMKFASELQAFAYIDDAEIRKQQEQSVHWQTAKAYLCYGDTENALASIEKYADYGSSPFQRTVHDAEAYPPFAPLLGEPRFKAAMAKLRGK